MSNYRKRRRRDRDREDAVMMRIVLTNGRALRALGVVADAVADAAESQPWNGDMQRALRAMKYAFNHLGMVVEEEGE